MMTWLIMELEKNIKLFLCNTWKVTAHRFGTKWWYVVNYTIFIVGELFIKFFLTVVLFPVQNLLFVKSVQNISESWQKHHLWYYDCQKKKGGPQECKEKKWKKNPRVFLTFPGWMNRIIPWSMQPLFYFSCVAGLAELKP